MAEYTSTRDKLELSDIYVDVENDGVYESLVLTLSATVPVEKIESNMFVRSLTSGSLYRAIAQGWITVVSTVIPTLSVTLNNGVVYQVTSNSVRWINGSLSATVTLA